MNEDVTMEEEKYMEMQVVRPLEGLTSTSKVEGKEDQKNEKEAFVEANKDNKEIYKILS